MEEKDCFAAMLSRAFGALSLDVSDTQAERFYRYYTLLAERNRVMNLTGITDAEGVIEKHFADSLLPLRLGLVRAGATLVDVGSGAGFPGLPLAIMCPDASFTLMDALTKRTEFLCEVCEALGLENVTVVRSRAETAGQGKWRETFDVALSRAVSPLAVLSELCLPLVRVGGCMAALKSRAASEEIENARRAVSLLGGADPVILGSDDRNVVCVDKLLPTPAAYPRRDGMPEKRPL